MQPNLKRLKSCHFNTPKDFSSESKSENTQNVNIVNPLGNQLPESFFNKSTYELAQELLGKILVHNINGHILKCKIVETEVYPGGEDTASHSYNGRQTPGNAAMFMRPGTSYVYFIYGMYYCFNISSADYGGVVLIRAGEPVEETEAMISNRIMSKQWKCKQKQIKFKDICNGPGKLCIAMQIDKKTCNMIDMSKCNKLWIENPFLDTETDDKIIVVSSTRIGIDKTGTEAVRKLYRFYILGNVHVSKIDKIQEIEIKQSIST